MAVKTQIKNLYEVTVVIKPNLSEKDLETNITQIEDAIKNYGGSIVKADEVQKRRCMHKVKGFKEGNYLSILFNSAPEVPNTLKRTLAISDDVIRYMVTRKEN